MNYFKLKINNYFLFFIIIFILLNINYITLFIPKIDAKELRFNPYFVNLKWNKANVRSGPGKQYPILWQFQRARLPIEIIGEYDSHFKIRYLDGDQGWLHKRLIQKKERWAMVQPTSQVLRNKPDINSKPIFIAESGVIGKVLICREKWCKLEIKKMSGWIPKNFIWGVYPDETIE
tara:strand:+ start:444 stop:971 length:528 start_codon:yes stop_codon:yes gene_type:complete